MHVLCVQGCMFHLTVLYILGRERFVHALIQNELFETQDSEVSE